LGSLKVSNVEIAADAAESKPSKFSDDTYKYLELFGDVFERVRKDYVEPVSDQTLIENAINGMLTALDPPSSYLPAKSFQDMQEQTKGEFGCLASKVTMESGFIKVGVADRRYACRPRRDPSPATSSSPSTASRCSVDAELSG